MTWQVFLSIAKHTTTLKHAKDKLPFKADVFLQYKRMNSNKKWLTWRLSWKTESSIIWGVNAG